MTRIAVHLINVLMVLFAVARAALAFEITPVTSEKGIAAWLVQSAQPPIVTLKFSVPGGAALDVAGKEGAAVLMGEMLNEGAGVLDSEAFKLALAEMSSGVSLGVSADYLYGTVYCLKEHCEKTFALMRAALLEPRFEAKDFARVLQQRVQGLQQSESNQNAVAGEAWSALAFPGHHYGRPNAGTSQRLVALTLEDVKAAYARQLTRSRIAVSAVGDIDAPALGRALDLMFGNLPQRDLGEIAKRVEVAAGPILKVIPYEATQSVVQFGGPGIREDGPERIAAYVLGEILGGGVNFAWLNQSLRERSGLTYGVGLGHAPTPYTAYMQGSFSTGNGTVKQALALLDGELAKMAAEGPSAEELRRIKSYLNGSFVLRLTNSDSIADMLLSALRDGRGTDFVERRKQRISAVTVDDVKKVAARLLAPETRIVVVVGKE
jgi:zinc protease